MSIEVNTRREELIYAEMVAAGETEPIGTVFFFPTREDQKMARELRRRGIFPDLPAVLNCAGRIATTLENLKTVRRLHAGIVKQAVHRE